ncbi:MAG: helix-turn-helix domain-containing protein [Saprospiraceae bacterium]|nr:helix-turn-helix domain-containing protein [Saprospiraceae bacterium]
MKLIEAQPKSTFLQKMIDRYQFYDCREGVLFKSIPNGKIEGWTIISGQLELLDDHHNQFVPVEEHGFYPMSKEVTLFRIPETLICLNIKLNLTVLSYPFFDNFFHHWRELSTASLFDEQSFQSIQALDFLQEGSIDTSVLDAALERFFQGQQAIPQLSQIIVFMMERLDSSTKIGHLAKAMNMSTKTLERLTYKHFSKSPKELWNIIRFGKATAHLRKVETSKLIEALSFGYYDQSHFNKTCRQITGLAPRELFNQMKLPTNDLLFEGD